MSQHGDKRENIKWMSTLLPQRQCFIVLAGKKVKIIYTLTAAKIDRSVEKNKRLNLTLFPWNHFVLNLKKKKIFQIFKQCQKSSECFNTLIIQYYYGDSKHNSLETAHGGHKVLKKK